MKDEDDESEDEEEEEEEAKEDAAMDAMADIQEQEHGEEAEQVTLDASLAAAALKSASKTKAKAISEKVQTAKKAVDAQLSETKPPSVKKAAIKQPRRRLFKLPYIVRALLNPFTALAMTKAYWASLVDLNYMQRQQPQQGQELRSALEEKAKRNSGGPPKGRRKMKRGQAKTLADLPQLST